METCGNAKVRDLNVRDKCVQNLTVPDPCQIVIETNRKRVMFNTQMKSNLTPCPSCLFCTQKHSPKETESFFDLKPRLGHCSAGTRNGRSGAARLHCGAAAPGSRCFGLKKDALRSRPVSFRTLLGEERASLLGDPRNKKLLGAKGIAVARS